MTWRCVRGSSSRRGSSSSRTTTSRASPGRRPGNWLAGPPLAQVCACVRVCVCGPLACVTCMRRGTRVVYLRSVWRCWCCVWRASCCVWQAACAGSWCVVVCVCVCACGSLPLRLVVWVGCVGASMRWRGVIICRLGRESFLTPNQSEYLHVEVAPFLSLPKVLAVIKPKRTKKGAIITSPYHHQRRHQ